MTTNIQKFILLVLLVFSMEDVSSSFFRRQGSDEIEFVDMKDGCVKKTEEQIRMEIGASMKYLSMAAFFSQEDINRPGFAKLFFDAASEERQHAFHLVNYLTMRGRYMNDGKGNPVKFAINMTTLVSDAMTATVLGMGSQLRSLVVGRDEEKNTTSGLIGLQNALKMEVTVTKSIRELIKKCENEMMYHDYHVSL